MVYTITYVAIIESLACYTSRPQTTECFHSFNYTCASLIITITSGLVILIGIWLLSVMSVAVEMLQ